MVNQLKDEFDLSDSYTVDPVSTSNISAIAEITGVPNFFRDGRVLAQNTGNVGWLVCLYMSHD